MTAITTVPPSQAARGPLFAGVVRSEARKLATVRSTWWALLAVVAFNVVTAALLGALLPGHLSGHQKATLDSVRVSLGGLHLSQIAIGVLGVLAVTGEFVPTLLTALLPSSWQAAVGPYLPMNAGDSIYTVRPEAHILGPWTGFGVFCLYAAAALAAGFVLIGRRDA
jgi:hypothetical protein